MTGLEAEFAANLAEELNDLGVKAKLADFLPGRPNVWAVRSGGRRANSLDDGLYGYDPRARLAGALVRYPARGFLHRGGDRWRYSP